jgi:hypothetical protein
MSSALDITESVQPPRAAFLDYPLGHTTGKPNEPELQREILVAALDAFRSLDSPGVKRLPFAWSSNESWKESVFGGGDERQPRHATPQYQTAEDRERAEGCGPETCPPST